MPELPEVEIYARTFAAHALNRRILRVRVLDPRILAVREAAFRRAFTRRSFGRVRRHGKHLFADAGSVWLRLHFGMTGDLSFYRDSRRTPRFARVVFDFEGGDHLAFEDVRLFGVADTVVSPEAFIAERGLGPDALDRCVTFAAFQRLLEGRRGAVKALLLSQEVVAGIGNLYADEVLFRSAIDPRRPVDDLSAREVRALQTAMRNVLRTAIERLARGEEQPAQWLLWHRERGARCPRCGGVIGRSVVGGRTTYSCSRHQAVPPLASPRPSRAR
ncbi:MAG TPA: DNA-formamidopyrimidine glycosylase family protein [Thermoanaerobaculia bacterium]|nr:DNA-formamidopyrimidine glycosylase family protein [Thermoanaerobaculia bacterium]